MEILLESYEVALHALELFLVLLEVLLLLFGHFFAKIDLPVRLRDQLSNARVFFGLLLLLELTCLVLV